MPLTPGRANKEVAGEVQRGLPRSECLCKYIDEQRHNGGDADRYDWMYRGKCTIITGDHHIISTSMLTKTNLMISIHVHNILRNPNSKWNTFLRQFVDTWMAKQLGFHWLNYLFVAYVTSKIIRLLLLNQRNLLEALALTLEMKEWWTWKEQVAWKRGKK